MSDNKNSPLMCFIFLNKVVSGSKYKNVQILYSIIMKINI